MKFLICTFTGHMLATLIRSRRRLKHSISRLFVKITVTKFMCSIKEHIGVKNKWKQQYTIKFSDNYTFGSPMKRV